MRALTENWQARYENMIREGHALQVRAEIDGIRNFDLPRDQLAALAAVARRVGLPDLTLRLLKPIVRPEIVLEEEATPLECALYASALGRIGAIEEALVLLNKIKHLEASEISLYLAFTYMSQWNYTSALKALNRYLRSNDLTDYDRLAAKLHVASCYQYLDEKTAEKNRLIEEILTTARARRWVRLLKNALELSAQAAISESNWPRAQMVLSEAAELSNDGDLLIRKWMAILKLKLDGVHPETLNALAEVGAKAEASGDWETARECDFYRALETRDPDLFAHVYFGTSHRAYRQRLERLADGSLTLPPSYVWGRSRDRQNEPSRVFDLASGKELHGQAQLKVGQSLLRLLRFLATDFYRAFPLGAIFAHIYPDEHYNFETSPARIRRLVDRLRAWFVENEIPLEITVNNLLVRLRIRGDYGLKLARDPVRMAERTLMYEQLATLRERWPYQGFTPAQAAAHLQVSIDKVRRLLKAAVVKKRLRHTGRGRAARFSFSR
jgi:hypothetical protein